MAALVASVLPDGGEGARARGRHNSRAACGGESKGATGDARRPCSLGDVSLNRFSFGLGGHAILARDALELNVGLINLSVPRRLEQQALNVDREGDGVCAALEGHHEAVPDSLHLVAVVARNSLADEGVVGVDGGGHCGRRMRPQHR